MPPDWENQSKQAVATLILPQRQCEGPCLLGMGVERERNLSRLGRSLQYLSRNLDKPLGLPKGSRHHILQEAKDSQLRPKEATIAQGHYFFDKGVAARLLTLKNYAGYL